MNEAPEDRCLHFQPDDMYEREDAREMISALRRIVDPGYIDDIIPWTSRESNKLHAFVVFTSVAIKSFQKSMDLTGKRWKAYELDKYKKDVFRNRLHTRNQVRESKQVSQTANSSFSNENRSGNQLVRSRTQDLSILNDSNIFNNSSPISTGPKTISDQGMPPNYASETLVYTPSESGRLIHHGVRGPDGLSPPHVTYAHTSRNSTSSRAMADGSDFQNHPVTSYGAPSYEPKRRRESLEYDFGPQRHKRQNTSPGPSSSHQVKNSYQSQNNRSFPTASANDSVLLSARDKETSFSRGFDTAFDTRRQPTTYPSNSLNNDHSPGEQTHRSQLIEYVGETGPGNTSIRPSHKLDRSRSPSPHAKYRSAAKRRSQSPPYRRPEQPRLGSGSTERYRPKDYPSEGSSSLRDRLGIGNDTKRVGGRNERSGAISEISLGQSSRQGPSSDSLLSRISDRSGSLPSTTQSRNTPSTFAPTTYIPERSTNTQGVRSPAEFSAVRAENTSERYFTISDSPKTGLVHLPLDEQLVDDNGSNEGKSQVAPDPTLLARITSADAIMSSRARPPRKKAPQTPLGQSTTSAKPTVSQSPRRSTIPSATSFSEFQFSPSFKEATSQLVAAESSLNQEIITQANSADGTLLSRIDDAADMQTSRTAVPMTGLPSPPREPMRSTEPNSVNENSEGGESPDEKSTGPPNHSVVEQESSSKVAVTSNYTSETMVDLPQTLLEQHHEPTVTKSDHKSDMETTSLSASVSSSVDASARSRLTQIEDLLQTETEKNTMLQDLLRTENEKNAKLQELVASLGRDLAGERGKRQRAENELREMHDRLNQSEALNQVLQKVKRIIDEATSQEQQAPQKDTT